jgi:hypothetical protein
MAFAQILQNFDEIAGYFLHVQRLASSVSICVYFS